MTRYSRYRAAVTVCELLRDRAVPPDGSVVVHHVTARASM